MIIPLQQNGSAPGTRHTTNTSPKATGCDPAGCPGCAWASGPACIVGNKGYGQDVDEIHDMHNGPALQ